jgi:hypothetical protein
MFHVGQKVVCLDDSSESLDGTKFIEKDAIYTIRWVGIFDLGGIIVPTLCLRLAGINRGEGVWDIRHSNREAAYDMPYRATRFRPVIERKTDISIFTEMLTPSPACSKEFCGND